MLYWVHETYSKLNCTRWYIRESERGKVHTKVIICKQVWVKTIFKSKLFFNKGNIRVYAKINGSQDFDSKI